MINVDVLKRLLEGPYRGRSELEGDHLELMEEVRVLDGINGWRSGRDPELMKEWNAARHVVLTPVARPVNRHLGRGNTL